VVEAAGERSRDVTLLRRLDHVAVVVRNTENALRFYRDRLGLTVHSSEELADLGVRLTYLDVGNAFLQLVEPTRPTSPLAEWLERNGEGLHHICFGVDDVAGAISSLSDNGSSVTLGTGRGRISGFLGTDGQGVLIECTQFMREQDVDCVAGWLRQDSAGVGGSTSSS
jgi:methylmalonyl-CoA/ethylmalonyl-CoA epimerase